MKRRGNAIERAKDSAGCQVRMGRRANPKDCMALSPKQEAFAQAIAKGTKNSDAYRQAYNTGGMTPKTVHEKASRLAKQGKVGARVAELRAPAIQAVRVEIEDALRQVARIIGSDPRRLFNADGTLKSIHELDDDTAAAVASFEVLEEFEGKGEERKLVGYTKKLKLWDKNAAINMAMKHLGAYERDNAQRAENLALQVVLVDGPQ